MPSWIKEEGGLEWLDETYTTKQTNQKVAQLHKKVEAGKLRSLPGPDGNPLGTQSPTWSFCGKRFRSESNQRWRGNQATSNWRRSTPGNGKPTSNAIARLIAATSATQER